MHKVNAKSILSPKNGMNLYRGWHPWLYSVPVVYFYAQTFQNKEKFYTPRQLKNRLKNILIYRMISSIL